MNAAMAHRGPDDEGYLFIDTRSCERILCGGPASPPSLHLPDPRQMDTEQFDLVLGSRRLAILDLSPAGHMPMTGSDGQNWVVFNGEIYNYRELREELAGHGYTFRNGTDTEVILAAYAEWGTGCLAHFNGMFGIALWDAERRLLFCARDRFGVKPFYYYRDGEIFAFASEIKALVQHPAIPCKPDDQAVFDYLVLGLSDHTERTFFENIVALPPGHFAVVNLVDRSLHIERWWQVEINTGIETYDAGKLDRTCRDFADLLEDAVRIRLRSDVPVGTALSGGLDSSSIVVLANRLLLEEQVIPPHLVGDHQQTFTARNAEAEIDEYQYSSLIVRQTGAQEHLTYPTAERLWANYESFLWHQDEPVNSTSQFAQWCVMELAKSKGVTVLLDGQGADEILAGYLSYVPLYVDQVRQHAGRRGALKAAWQAAQIGGAPVTDVLFDHVKHRLPWHAQRLIGAFRRTQLGPGQGGTGLTYWQLPADLMERFQDRQWQPPTLGADGLAGKLYGDLTSTNLPKLLRYEDRNSMAFSLEARLPFLDFRVVQSVFRMPLNYRFHEGWSKYILRRALRDRLPAEITWRKTKLGYPTPEVNWLRAGSETVRRILATQALHPDMAAYVQPEAVQTLLAMPDATLASAPGVWRIVNLAVWHDLYFQRRWEGAPVRAGFVSHVG
jgi:asparagine synthase (glutamine-hydrolysing)